MPDFETTILALARLSEEAGGAATAKGFADALSLPADSEIFTTIVASGRCDLITRYLAAKNGGPGWDRLIAQPRNLRLDHLIQNHARNGRKDLLAALQSGGFSLDHARGELLWAVSASGQDEIFIWVVKQLWKGDLPFSFLRDLITSCGPKTPERTISLLAQILETRAREGQLDAHSIRTAYDQTSPKLFAALMIAGPDHASLKSFFSQGLPRAASSQAEARLHCARLAQSNHGRIQLLAREPDLAAIIARPPIESCLGLGHLP